MIGNVPQTAISPVVVTSGLRKSQPATGEDSASRRRTSVADISSLNVLVVDDEATTRLILQNMLQKAGYRRALSRVVLHFSLHLPYQTL